MDAAGREERKEGLSHSWRRMGTGAGEECCWDAVGGLVTQLHLSAQARPGDHTWVPVFLAADASSTHSDGRFPPGHEGGQISICEPLGSAQPLPALLPGTARPEALLPPRVS